MLAGLLESPIRARLGTGLGRRESWALVLLLALGASGAKVVLLPMVGAGLFVRLALVWLRARKLEPTAAIGLALCIDLLGGRARALRGLGGGLRLGIGGTYEQMPASSYCAMRFPTPLAAEGSVLGDQFGSRHGAAAGCTAAGPGLVLPAGGRLGQGKGVLARDDGNRPARLLFTENYSGSALYFASRRDCGDPLAAAGLCRLAGPTRWAGARAGRAGVCWPRLRGLLFLCAVAYGSGNWRWTGARCRALALAYGSLAIGLAGARHLVAAGTRPQAARACAACGRRRDRGGDSRAGCCSSTRY